MTYESESTRVSSYITSNPDAESCQFVQRVAHLPVVALSLARLTELYQQTKLRHELLSYALAKGEQTVWSSMDLASGIAAKTGLQGPLNRADSSACYMLSKVEEKLPIITYTPDEIKTSTRRMYEDNVQPRIDQLTSMKDNTVQKYQDVKDYGTHKLSEARQLGAATVKTVLDAPVQRVQQTVEWSLNAADSLVDRLLPEAESERFSSTNGLNHGNLDHAKILSNKLRQRIYARIAENVRTAQLLAQALQIVDALKHTSAANSVHHILEDIRRLSGSVDVGEVSLSNGRSRALFLVKGLSTQLKDALENNTRHLTAYLPDHVTERLHQATDAAREIFHEVGNARNLDDLSHTLTNHVHNYAAFVQTMSSNIMDSLTDTYLIKWLIPEYSNIGSLDIHMHG